MEPDEATEQSLYPRQTDRMNDRRPVVEDDTDSLACENCFALSAEWNTSYNVLLDNTTRVSRSRQQHVKNGKYS